MVLFIIKLAYVIFLPILNGNGSDFNLNRSIKMEIATILNKTIDRHYQKLLKLMTYLKTSFEILALLVDTSFFVLLLNKFFSGIIILKCRL